MKGDMMKRDMMKRDMVVRDAIIHDAVRCVNAPTHDYAGRLTTND